MENIDDLSQYGWVFHISVYPRGHSWQRYEVNPTGESPYYHQSWQRKHSDVPRSLGKPSVCISSIGNCAWICWSSCWYFRRFMGFWVWLNGRVWSQLQYYIYIYIEYSKISMIFYYDDDPTFSNPISMSQNLAITGDVMAPNHITTQQRHMSSMVSLPLYVELSMYPAAKRRRASVESHVCRTTKKYEDINTKKRKHECCDLS